MKKKFCVYPTTEIQLHNKFIIISRWNNVGPHWTDPQKTKLPYSKFRSHLISRNIRELYYTSINFSDSKKEREQKCIQFRGFVVVEMDHMSKDNEIPKWYNGLIKSNDREPTIEKFNNCTEEVLTDLQAEYKSELE